MIPLPRGAFDRSAVRAVGVGAEAPAHDALGVEAYQLRAEVWVDALPALLEDLRPAACLHPARLPGRQHVVHHEGGPSGTPRVAELLAPAHVMAAGVYGVELGVVAERDGNHVRLALPVHRRQPAEPLAPQVLDLRPGKRAHASLPRSPAGGPAASRARS